MNNKRVQEIKAFYHLEPHVEGGSFAEVYTSPDEKAGRPLAGSIYFLLEAGEVSRLHQIDCDEIWYYHEGCGMRITVYSEGARRELLLGKDVQQGQQVMAVVPKGSIFGAVNLEEDGFTFVSCVTVPHFTYEGFRLLDEDEAAALEADCGAGPL